MSENLYARMGEPATTKVDARTAGCMRTCTIIGALILLLIGLLIWAAVVWLERDRAEPRGEVRQNARAVQPLLNAREMYRADHGDYPRTLHDPVPEYIAAVPRPPFEFHADGWYYVSGPEEVQLAGRKGRNENVGVEFPRPRLRAFGVGADRLHATERIAV